MSTLKIGEESIDRMNRALVANINGRVGPTTRSGASATGPSAGGRNTAGTPAGSATRSPAATSA